MNPFQLLSKPIWCSNDHLISIWTTWGERRTPATSQFPGAATLWWISMLSVRCILETGSHWVSKLILYFSVEPQVQNYFNLSFSLIAFGTKWLCCVVNTAGKLETVGAKLLLAPTCKLVCFQMFCFFNCWQFHMSPKGAVSKIYWV